MDRSAQFRLKLEKPTVGILRLFWFLRTDKRTNKWVSGFSSCGRETKTSKEMIDHLVFEDFANKPTVPETKTFYFAVFAVEGWFHFSESACEVKELHLWPCENISKFIYVTPKNIPNKNCNFFFFFFRILMFAWIIIGDASCCDESATSRETGGRLDWLTDIAPRSKNTLKRLDSYHPV